MLKISLKLIPFEFYFYLRIRIKKVAFKVEITNLKKQQQNNN